ICKRGYPGRSTRNQEGGRAKVVVSAVRLGRAVDVPTPPKPVYLSQCAATGIASATPIGISAIETATGQLRHIRVVYSGKSDRPMSALGQKQTLKRFYRTSALPPKADIS